MPRQVHLHSSLAVSAATGWDFRSSEPILTLRCDSASAGAELRDSNHLLGSGVDPLAALQWMSEHIPKNARWVGYLSYDLGRLFERVPSVATDDLRLPLYCFSLHTQEPITTQQRLRYLQANSSGCKSRAASADDQPLPDFRSSLPDSQFIDRVARALEFIQAGDVFQVNISHRLTAPLRQTPQKIWQNLLQDTPAAYGAFLDCGDHAIISNSPELFLRVQPDRRIITRPIKGTRPNQPGMETQLRESIKDQAELNMIIDLERNDLGRVCEPGSVRVTQPRTIESHPTVLHGVATIEGRLREEIGFLDVLRATFPGGSITGAPKIRAMQVIEDLEPIRRGPYCGAVGYLAGDGSMQFSIAIRTMIARGGQIHLSVGAGIVADSRPEDEYAETLVKARAMLNALRPASSG
jgi:para-aminobenzoate synthetase component 1